MGQELNGSLEGNKNLQSKEEQKASLAKTFGLDLSDIEHVKLENGKEFFKFIDPETREVKMVENLEHNSSMMSSFESVQQELSFFQGKDQKKNARDIYEYNMKNKNIELKLVSLSELKNNKYR